MYFIVKINSSGDLVAKVVQRDNLNTIVMLHLMITIIYVYITDSHNHRVQKFDTHGNNLLHLVEKERIKVNYNIH